MPLDALCLRGVVTELQGQIVGTRIEKIQQPARDQVVLTLRGNRKLLWNVGANQPRLHFTSLPRENPAAPPMFCMLLRKHLSGGYVTGLEQAGLDRVVILTVQTTDELEEAGNAVWYWNVWAVMQTSFFWTATDGSWTACAGLIWK